MRLKLKLRLRPRIGAGMGGEIETASVSFVCPSLLSGVLVVVVRFVLWLNCSKCLVSASLPTFPVSR